MTRLRDFLRDSSGTAAIEFVLTFPIVFLIFTASFESSMFMARYVFLERAVDQTVRQIRLGKLEGTSHQNLKKKICESGLMIGSIANCINGMKIWMQPISTASFSMAIPSATCVDRAQDINVVEPVANEFAYGTDNEIMLIKICLKETPMFPTTGVSVKMPTFPDGTYALIVTSVFVNEPG